MIGKTPPQEDVLLMLRKTTLFRCGLQALLSVLLVIVSAGAPRDQQKAAEPAHKGGNGHVGKIIPRGQAVG